jgi:Tfp pilus assembly protein PilN
LSNLLQEINKLKGSNVILTNRNENLASQIEEIKKMRDDKEAKVVRLSE